MKVLHIRNEKAGGKYYFPFDVKPRSIFANNNISNEYTIVSRVRLDHDGHDRYNVCFAKIGYDASSKKGMWLGFSKTYSDSSTNYPGCMRVAAYRTPQSGGSDTGVYFNLPVPTNTWVDLAVVVGNGKLRVGVATPASLTSHNNNPTIAFDEKPMWTGNCALLDDDKYRLFCLDGQQTWAEATTTDTSSFIGTL